LLLRALLALGRLRRALRPRRLGLLDEQVAARRTRDRALHVEEVVLGLDLDHLEVAHRAPHVAHVAAEPLAGPETRRALVRRHGARIAPALGAVAPEAARDVVAL